MQDIFSNIFYIIVALMVLLFMITVHELGHYAAGKILKFKINEFSIGFGQPLFKRVSKKTGEVFSLRMIPLGGACVFEGEDADMENPQAFNNQKAWKRIIVLVAGVAMNFFFALIICMAVFVFSGMNFLKATHIYPDAAAPVAEEYKLKEDDVILAIEGRYLFFANDFDKSLDKIETGEIFEMTVVREGERQTVQVVKREYKYTDTEGAEKTATGLGIRPNAVEVYKFGFFESISNSVAYCFRMAGVILGFFGELITGKISLSQIGGPITTIDYTAQVARLGFVPLMEIVTLIGVNLAVFNLLPIPALDGSRILFILIEMIRKKPVKREVEGWIHFVGFLLLIGFVLLADILQLFNKF